MTSFEYRRLCVLLDDLLLRTPVTESRLSVSVLHMIRYHPVFTDLYAPLFRPGPALLARARDVVDRGRRLAVMAAHLARVTANRANSRSGRESGGECDVLLVSYLFDPGRIDNADDIYFGGLAEALTARHCPARVIRFDSTPGYRNVNSRQGDAAREPVLDRFLPLRAEWRHVMQQWRESRVLARMTPPGDDEVARRLPRFASTNALSMWSLLNLRRVQLVADVLARLKPRLLVTTYEGLPWERMLYARARTLVPGIRCAGYQQAPVFRNQHAIARALGAPFDPDVIFTSSAHTAERLRAYSNYRSTNIKILGSKRSRAQPAEAQRPAPWPDQPGILVLPEGIMGECVRLFGFAVRAAVLLPGCTFYLRLHPNMSFVELRRQAPTLLASMPPNVVLSDVDFAADVARSQIALYRASSAIVNSAAAGALPVFVGDVDADDLDPLDDVAALRPRVLSPEDLVAVVHRRESCPAAVQAFAARYYDPLDPDCLADYVRSINTHEPS